MMKPYRKKPIVVWAEQWFQVGDVKEAPIEPWDDDNDGDTVCQECSFPLKLHGKCKTLEGYHIVCPGDFIIKGVKGEFYPCKPQIFHLTYESVE